MKRYIKANTEIEDIPSSSVLLTDLSQLHVGDKIFQEVSNEFEGHYVEYGFITAIYDDHALATMYDCYDRPMERVWIDDYVLDDYPDIFRTWIAK